MKVILIEGVDDLGSAGQVLNVKDGYARNYLIPKKKALAATPENIRKMEQMREEIEAKQLKVRSEAEELAQRLSAMSLTIPRQAGENEKLFGSVTSIDIERALHEAGVDVERKRILMREPIKSLGDYQVPIRLHPDVTAPLKVSVIQS
jgi:large subunit ribosomal protein L9